MTIVSGRRAVSSLVSGRRRGGVPDTTPPPPLVALLSDGDSTAWLGNSYTSNYRGVPDLVAYLLQELGGVTISAGPPPYLPTSIGNSSGYYPGRSMAQMVLNGAAGLPDLGAGSTDGTDALATMPEPPDHIVLTSGFVQEAAHPSGDILDWTREAVAELLPLGGDVIIRMTHEGVSPDIDGTGGLDGYTDHVRDQVAAARTIEAESLPGLAGIVPEAYVWWWLQVGDPVPSYVTLTHPNITTAGGRRYGWCYRTQYQGGTGLYVPNSHQGWLGMMVDAWTWAAFALGLDIESDDTFSAPLPSGPGEDFMTTTEVYLGPESNSLHFNNSGPGGPSDSPSVVPWNATVRAEITRRIVVALNDYRAGTTAFE